MKQTIEDIATNFNVTKKLAKEVVEAVFASLEETLLVNGEMKIAGLGSFKLVTKSARSGRNPKTGEALTIPARKAIKFTATKSLKEAIQ